MEGNSKWPWENCTENVQLWHPLLAMGDTSNTFEIWQWGLFGLESSILGSENTLNNVECLIQSQPSSGIIRATADYFRVEVVQHRGASGT
jgi:hypothetical protein